MATRIYHYIHFIFIFIKALIVANWQVVKLALRPNLNIKPGFISVPMAARGDFEISVLANAITLTPGTISVHIPENRKSIVIHCIDIGDDPEPIRQDVRNTLESNILKWTRPRHARQNPSTGATP